jgi:biotin carboxyl carrier protein
MNYTIKVDGKVYDVKILDLQSIPIKVVVDDTEIEVWPEHARIQKDTTPASARPAGVMPVSAGAASTAIPANGDSKVIKAPLPGVIISIKAKTGDTVQVGQELCTIEAMKMKNVIRATRAGKIATILVNVGETVQHHDLLMEFES